MSDKSKKLSPVQLHAIASIGKAASNVRDQLDAGKTFRPEFGVMIRGELSVGQSQPTNTSAGPNQALLIAFLLSQFGPRKRKQVAAELTKLTNAATKAAPLTPSH